MTICTITGCDRPVLARGWCSKHYQRWLNSGDPLTAREKAADGAGSITGSGYRMVREDNDRAFEHVRIAEKVLGRPLPVKAQVHHVDSDPLNNANDNLVVCQDQSYHRLLHIRTRALDACGNASYLKCVYCKTYDSPDPSSRKTSRGSSDLQNTAVH